MRQDLSRPQDFFLDSYPDLSTPPWIPINGCHGFSKNSPRFKAFIRTSFGALCFLGRFFLAPANRNFTQNDREFVQLQKHLLPVLLRFDANTHQKERLRPDMPDVMLQFHGFAQMFDKFLEKVFALEIQDIRIVKRNHPFLARDIKKEATDLVSQCTRIHFYDPVAVFFSDRILLANAPTPRIFQRRIPPRPRPRKNHIKTLTLVIRELNLRTTHCLHFSGLWISFQKIIGPGNAFLGFNLLPGKRTLFLFRCKHFFNSTLN